MKKTALVTGANRGLGLETCRQLAAAGFHVILTARKKQAGQRATDQLTAQGLDVSFLQLDVASDDSIQKSAEYLKSNHIQLEN